MKFEGTILERSDDRITVRMSEQPSGYPEFEAEILLGTLPESHREHAVAGAPLTWIVDAGKLEIRVRHSTVSESEREAAVKQASDLLDAIEWQ